MLTFIVASPLRMKNSPVYLVSPYFPPSPLAGSEQVFLHGLVVVVVWCDAACVGAYALTIFVTLPLPKGKLCDVIVAGVNECLHYFCV